MRFWHLLRARGRWLLRCARREAHLGEELQSHIGREAERLEANGVPADAASPRGRRALGGVEQIKEKCRAGGISAIDVVVRDTRHAGRRLARDWGFSAAAVLILGLGIGANTAIFSAVNAALLRGQPVADPERLVDIYQNGANPGGVDASSYPAYLDIAEYTDVFASTTAAAVPRGVTYQHEDGLRPAVAEHTTSTYLSVLGLRPSLGRWFDAAEDTRGAEVVAVLGHQAWMRKFRGDPSVIGRIVRIEGVPVTIIGVGPAGHNGTLNIGIVTDLWLPISSLPALGARAGMLERRPEEAGFLVKARLREGITVAQAQAAMRILGTRLASQYPDEDPGRGISVFPSSDVRVHPQFDPALRWIASVLLGIVGLVLAVACSNLATLLLVRGAARAKEVSVRLALGATRGRLVRHLLMESLLLSAAGGAAGCALARWTIQSLGALELPIVVDLSLDTRVLLFALGLSLVTGLAFGVAPALKATSIDLVPTLRDQDQTRPADRRWLTLKNALVMFQVAVSVVLLGATSILFQMLSVSRTQRTGFAVDGVTMLQTDARFAGHSTTKVSHMLEDLRRRIAAMPGVEGAVLTRGLPMQETGRFIIVDGSTPGPAVPAGGIWAGPGYFDLLRIPILYGRAIDERDRADTPRVAVISETMARQYFGAANAVGGRFRFEQETGAWFDVIGVARDTGTSDLQGDLVDPTPQLFYRSFTQADGPPTTVLARTSLDAAALVGAMQRELRAVDASLPVVSAKTMGQYLEDSLAAPKAVAGFLGALGVLGLALASIGLYAVVAFTVSRRSREIGIRMALGARREQVVWRVARDVAVVVGIGTGIGMILSLLVIVALRSAVAPAPGMSLYRPTADPVALAGIGAVMAIVGLAAACMPAWRAVGMDPVAALRRD